MKQLKRPKNLKPGDVIEVTWRDHWASSGWWNKDQALAQDAVTGVSIGFFVGYNKDGMIVLGGTWVEDDKQISTIQCRLWSDVTKIRKIK